jgi:hypothetical protein
MIPRARRQMIPLVRVTHKGTIGDEFWSWVRSWHTNALRELKLRVTIVSRNYFNYAFCLCPGGRKGETQQSECYNAWHISCKQSRNSRY